jgi:hypothetical protein
MDNSVAVAFEPTPLSALLVDYAQLFKLRLNSLVLLGGVDEEKDRSCDEQIRRDLRDRCLLN